jgi:hypothetical protein
MPVAASYVLPILRRGGAPPDELTGYLRDIAGQCELIIVDGSDPATFDHDADAWGGFACHLPPAPDVGGAYGKVRGVITGVRLASHERVVIADDDVRYRGADLDAVVAALDRHDLVSPQNHFQPLVWHAAWDTARSLLNRAFGYDYPGTLAVRRSTFLRLGGYDGDALFENLELIRTVEAGGGSVLHARGLHVTRLPPTTRHFFSQRVRQAYDDFARPPRLALALVSGPILGLALYRRAWRTIGSVAAATVVLAEIGRRRDGGRTVFPPVTAWCAPVWVLERAVTSWAAVGWRLTGGCRYAGARLRLAAHSTRTLRRRLAPAETA